MMGSSIAFLLEKAEDLSLTSEQTEQLTALQAEIEERNAPLLEKLSEIRGSGDREGMRSVMMELREGDREAVEKAMPLLEASQQEQAKALLQERRANRRRPGGS